MAQLVRVKLAEWMGERAGLHETSADHPGGFAAIDTQGVVYTVALTAAVSDRLSRKMIVLVETVPRPAGEPEPEPVAVAPKPAPQRRRR